MGGAKASHRIDRLLVREQHRVMKPTGNLPPRGNGMQVSATCDVCNRNQTPCHPHNAAAPPA
eukprot:4470022-Prymnesium_polylepis.1